MNTSTSVQIENLSIGYRVKGGVRTVGSGISGGIRQGELTCLLGENGVGKSTLMRTLAAFQPPLDGTVTIAGRPIDGYTPQQLAQTVGVVLTEKPNLGLMTTLDVVALGRSPYTGFWGRMAKEDDEIVEKAMEQVGVSHLSERRVATLSDGERQKVMIAKALAQQTDIILLDEPTAFLDYPNKVDTLLLLRRLCHEESKTIFLSTHDLELSLQAADMVWLMTRQEGLLTGTPRQLADNGALKRFVEKSRCVSFDTQRLSVSLKR